MQNYVRAVKSHYGHQEFSTGYPQIKNYFICIY